jgi:hypothetical protein
MYFYLNYVKLKKIKAKLATLDLTVSDHHDIESNWNRVKQQINVVIDKLAQV